MTDPGKRDPLLLTKDAVAELLAIDPETVTNLHRFKKLRGCKVGRALRWRPEDVTRFVAELQPDD